MNKLLTLVLVLVAIFSFAILATACSDDADQKCTSAFDAGIEYKICWEKGAALDMYAEIDDFLIDHPSAEIDDVENP